MHSRPLRSQYVSVPKEMGSFTPAAFMAGVVRGVLDAAGFPATVTAHLGEGGA